MIVGRKTTWQCFHRVPVAQDCFPSSLCSHTSASSGCSLGGGLKAGLWKEYFIIGYLSDVQIDMQDDKPVADWNFN